MQFKDLNLMLPLLEAVKKVGYETPSPIQEKTIPLVLNGSDVLGCAQTGTGKTAAFALPILQRLYKSTPREARGRDARPIRALILTPTRELAIQIYENFSQYGARLPLRTAVIFGGVNQNPQVEALRRGVDILVATPGRLNDLIGQGHISLADLEIFVLDEADRMLDMGFIHDVKKVIAKLPPKRQTLFFSATMPPEVEKLAVQLLHDPATVKISPVTKTVDKIGQSVFFTEKGNKVELLLWLMKQHQMKAVLVFTRTKHGANQVAAKLMKAGVSALAIHGNKSQNARQEALGRFKVGTLPVLVATDIAARGIDVAELPFVVNFNVPDTPEAYIHRIGRTGRAGLSGRAFTFCCAEELKDWWDIEKHTHQSVPVEQCPWSVADMQPVDAPPPGSHHRTNPQKQKSQLKQESQPKQESRPKQEKKIEPTSSFTEPSGGAHPSSFGSAYSSRYGTRPVRHFQSRVGTQPKAEDFPPPPPTGGHFRAWEADEVLPERRQIVALSEDKPLQNKEKSATKAAEKSAPTTENTERTPQKKRRHRGGRRHRKPNAAPKADPS